MSILNLEGAHQNELAATGEFNPQAPTTVLTLPSGQRVVVPTELLLHPSTSRAETAADRDESEATRTGVSPAAGRDTRDTANAAGNQQHRAAANDTVIPLVAEEMLVGKAQVETGRVHLRRETQEQVQTVSVPLANVSWEIEHVPMDQIVEAQPEIRQVGETIIFPLVEERMVVKRELWLREEVHVRKVTSVVEKSADFPVKRDVLVEQRAGPDAQPRA